MDRNRADKKLAISYNKELKIIHALRPGLSNFPQLSVQIRFKTLILNHFREEENFKNQDRVQERFYKAE